jgi:myotubularin-related protein 14
LCRSSTLSGGPEIYGRSGLDYLFPVTETSAEDEDEELTGAAQTQRDWQLFDRVRSQDIRLLKTLNVGTIIDFMVEKKKVKFGMK